MHFVLFLYVHMFGGKSDTLFGGKSVLAAGPRSVFPNTRVKVADKWEANRRKLAKSEIVSTTANRTSQCMCF